MHLQDEIVEIPENRVKFFGTRGKMLLPSPTSIASVLEKVPPRKVLTTNLLRQYLAEQFDVEAVCPVTTKKALVSLANDTTHDAPYWRVLNQNGNVISNLPDSAEKLREEGLSIASDGKKVSDYKSYLAELS